MYIFVGGQEQPNGVSSYINNIGFQLKNKGYDVVIFQFGGSSKEFEQGGVCFIQRKAPKSSMLAIPYIFFCSIPFIISHRNIIDVVNFQSTFLAFIPGWICRLFGLKVCYTQHSFGEDNHKHGRCVRWLISIISKISVFCCYKNFITISKSKASEFENKNNKSCHIIPCGVNRPEIFDDSSILERFNIRRNRYFLNICRIDPIKNLDVLIKAFLNTPNNTFQLVIGGNYSNSYGAELIKIVNNDPRVILVGSVSGLDKETLLKNCYVNCLVSSSEGMPISLMEGMAYSKACIVSNIPAIREIVTAKQGIWCTVKDVDELSSKIIYAENNPETLKSKGSSMYESVISQYTWDNITNKYINLVKELN